MYIICDCRFSLELKESLIAVTVGKYWKREPQDDPGISCMTDIWLVQVILGDVLVDWMLEYLIIMSSAM